MAHDMQCQRAGTSGSAGDREISTSSVRGLVPPSRNNALLLTYLQFEGRQRAIGRRFPARMPPLEGETTLMSSTSILRAALAAAAASIFAACSGPQTAGFVPSGSQTMAVHHSAAVAAGARSTADAGGASYRAGRGVVESIPVGGGSADSQPRHVKQAIPVGGGSAD
jgi:hypothetical protein